MFISQDRNYIQIGDVIADLRSNMSFNIDEAHPAFVCEMFKGQFVHSYKNNLVERFELMKKMKSLIQPLLQENADTLLEYEVRFGFNVLSEEVSFTSIRMIEEAWDFVKFKMLDELPLTITEGLWDWTKSMANKAWEGIKKGASFIINKGLPWFFEKLENFLLSPVGIGLDVALTAIGVGKIASAVIWGALGMWKIFQLFTGKIKNDIWSYIDIGICLIGLVFTGGAAKALKSVVKGAGRSVGKILSSPAIKPLVNLIKKGASAILGVLVKSIEWLGKILGPKASSLISTVKSKMTSVIEKLKSVFTTGDGLGKTIAKGVKGDIINPAKAALKGKGPVSLSKAAAKGTTYGLAFYGLEKGIEKGVQSYYGIDDTQMQNLKTMDSAIKQKYGDKDPFDQ